MVYTSCFALAEKLPKDRLVSIARKTPDAHLRTYPALAPTKEILSLYREGKIDASEYERRYRTEILSNLDPKQVLDDLG